MSGDHSEIRRDHIFVVGCQRSGTSVVWAGLTAHPDLRPFHNYDAATGYDPKELYYFRNLFGARRSFPSPMYGWDVDREYVRRMVDLTVRFCVEHHGTPSGRFVNANPPDALVLNEILESLPDSRVVYVLRHPQEVVWSSIHTPWAAGNCTDNEVRRQARHWSSFAEVANDVIGGRFGDSVLLLRHECLVADPEGEAARIASHVGVDLHPAIARMLGGPTFNSSFRNDANPRDAIAATRRVIAREQSFRRIVVDAVGRVMEELGYRDLGNPPLVARSTAAAAQA